MDFSLDPTVESRIDTLLDEMTRDEKIDMVLGDGMWHFRGCERLGVSAIRVTDCGHGVTNTGSQDCCATCFPTAIGQGATWNRELLETLGHVLGIESAALGNKLLLGPMVNLHRSPLNGRSFECFSEDPVLTGNLGAAVVDGIQSAGVAACIKGITANNIQFNQAESSSDIDERTLREIYLPNFRIPVKKSAPAAVMTCYNAINGEPSSESRHVLSDILKGEWEYPGFVVSDWRGTHSKKCISAGLDLEMPGPGKFMTAPQMIEALDSGDITPADLDDKVRRLLRCLLRVADTTTGNMDDLDSDDNRAVALAVAEESVTLLKNDGDLLPLDTAKIKKLAVIGPNAASARLGAGGSASVTPFFSVSPLEAIKDIAGDKVELSYQEAVTFHGDYPTIAPEFLRSADGRQGADYEFFNNRRLEGQAELSGVDAGVDYSWGWGAPGPNIGRNGWSARWSASVIPPVSGLYKLGACARDSMFRMYINGELLIDCWEETDDDENDGVVGLTNPSQCVNIDLEAGKPVEIRLDFLKLANKAALRLQWSVPGEPSPVEKAIAAARDADAVIMCMGLCNQHEGGSLDRETTELPDEQIELIQAVAKVNPNTIVALNSGGVITVSSWLDSARALLAAWYGGQSGGEALANIIFGRVNPSGRLPDTVPVKMQDCSWYGRIRSENNRIEYAEGVFMGYRHFDSHDIEVSFPFGFGLSYTNFKYSNMRISADSMSKSDTVKVTVDVANTGRRAGKEVVQLYIGDTESSLPRPKRELKGFEKIEIQPGQSQTVEFVITDEDLAFFDIDSNTWRVERGEFIVQVGPNSREGLQGSISYKGQ